MREKALIGCHEVPGYGGASTASYSLFQAMQRDGLDVSYVSVIGREDVEYLRHTFGGRLGNPQALARVYNCVLQAPRFDPHPELADFIHGISPTIMVATGWIAALFMKRAAPETPLIFIACGCRQMKELIQAGGVEDFVSWERAITHSIAPPMHCADGGWSMLERQAVVLSDLIVTNSEVVMSLYRELFPAQIGKIYPEVISFAQWIYHDARQFSHLVRPFRERDIDLLFIANRWNRPEKNYGLVKEIVSRRKDLAIHVVGRVEERRPNAIYHGVVVGREELFALMGRAKTVVCPSLFDAAPGILLEASAMGCNIIASKNCGNWRICHEQLLVEPFRLEGFLGTISRALVRRYEDHIDHFVGDGAYDKLLGALTMV